MRLMLGTMDSPELLVEVDNKFNPTDFKFLVINGNWNGHFKNGDIFVVSRDSDEPTSTCPYKAIILTDNQDRLRGHYQDVFDNFDNLDYIAPKKEVTIPAMWDDDIPF